MPNLTKRTVDAAVLRSKDYIIWCSGIRGFGVRVYPSGAKVFIAQSRVGGRTFRYKIGPFGPFTVDQARQRAIDALRKAHDGENPQRAKQDARKALSVAELCDLYLDHAKAGLVPTRFGRPKRPSTVGIDVGRVARHINPLVGSIPANSLNRMDVQKMVDDITCGKTAGRFKGNRPRGRAVVGGGSGAAARVASLLGGIYTWAEKRGFVSGINPVRGIDTILGEPRDRIASTEELYALGETLRAAVDAYPIAATALRLIALTGLRRNEACALKWKEIDAANHCLRLEETKTGKSVRPLGIAAKRLLGAVLIDRALSDEPARASSEWVFPNEDNTGPADLNHPLAKLFGAAGLHDIRSHDLRRTFATSAAELGFGDATIGELLGHARRGVTVRHYIRPPDVVLVAAADRVSNHIDAILKHRTAEVFDFKQSARLLERKGTNR